MKPLEEPASSAKVGTRAPGRGFVASATAKGAPRTVKLRASSDEILALLRRIAGGDRQAMQTFYETIGPDLHRFILTRVSDACAAADVLQETMLDVWRRAGAFEGRSAVRTWVYAIARNKAVDHLRRVKPCGVAEPDETIADETPSPEAAMLAMEDRAALHGCIARLKEVQRSAIHLAFFQDLTYAEIAEIEGCSVATVKTRIHYAKKLLLHCLSQKTRPCSN